MLIVGLGNPGTNYENTVHNIGFMAIDIVLNRLNLKLKEKSCQALWTAFFVGGQKHVIAKPQTYMNLSGESIKQLVAVNKWTSDDVVVIYDDIDLPIGSLRLRQEGSGGSHNGMKNIVDNLSTKNIFRIRVGVGDERGSMQLRDYVLSKIKGDRKMVLDKVLEKVADCVLDLIGDGDKEAAMRKYNGAVI